MVTEPQTSHPVSRASTGRRVTVGANVAMASVLVVGIVVALQWIAYESSARGARWDMTSSGVNSLNDVTVNLLRNLETKVTLTSLYFETDLEAADQPSYRRAVHDLLELYESTQRAKVTADWINPLSDHDKFKRLVTRLRQKPEFKEQIETYEAGIDHYKNELDPAMRALVQEELSQIGSIGGPMASGAARASVGQVENLLNGWASTLESTREQVDALTGLDNPQLNAAVNVLKTIYRDFSKTLKDIPKFSQAQLTRNPDMPSDAADYLRDAGSRYASLAGNIEGQITALQDLELLDIDSLLRKFTPNGNPIVVETEETALVVDFSSVWPPLDPSRAARAAFKDRGFKGEERVTSAILRATHKEQTVVVFVRYGDSPLFLGGFMPNQPPAPYSTMKEQLEEANFVVEEWDLKTSDDPPEVDPPPTRTIYVVLKPKSPKRNPFAQQQMDKPFTPGHLEKLLSALGDEPRALFIAGWYPGPFGPVPGTYEYNEYLKENWGISVDMSKLLIQTISFDVGKFGVDRSFFNMREVEVMREHPIVSGPLASLVTLPGCAPLDRSDSLPEGVEIESLVAIPQSDVIWGIRNLQTYQEQLSSRNYMIRADEDVLGPFEVAAAATRGDAKIVVISARDFAKDDVAFARELTMSSQGFGIRSRNPGNVVLLLNSLHWLNDNNEIMGIGRPIDAAVLEIGSDRTVKAVQALTILVWPALALVCGAATYWIRRR